MNSMADCFASSSKEATRSPAGILIRCLGASVATAGAAIHAQQTSAPKTSPAKAHRFIAFANIADPSNICVVLFAGRPTQSTFGQNDAIAALLDVDRKAALQEPNEGVGVAGAEVAANANAGNRRIA